MKGLFLSIIMVFGLIFTMISCQDESYKDPIMISIEGEWEILNEKGTQGTIIFTGDETFIMKTEKGNLSGDISLSPEDNKLSVTYAEYEDGEEYLTEEDYENGYFVKIEPIDSKSMYLINFPLFRNETIIIQRKE